MVSNFSTILLHLPDMRVINDAQVSTSANVIAIVIAFVITSLPATAPYAFRLCAPKAAGECSRSSTRSSRATSARSESWSRSR